MARFGALVASLTTGVLQFVFLNIHPPTKRPLRDQIAELDFIGLVVWSQELFASS